MSDDYTLKDYLREREQVAEQEREDAETSHQESFWMGRHTLLFNMIEFIEMGMFDDYE